LCANDYLLWSWWLMDQKAKANYCCGGQIPFACRIVWQLLSYYSQKQTKNNYMWNVIRNLLISGLQPARKIPRSPVFIANITLKTMLKTTIFCRKVSSKWREHRCTYLDSKFEHFHLPGSTDRTIVLLRACRGFPHALVGNF
jgi:hypothetical protein